MSNIHRGGAELPVVVGALRMVVVSVESTVVALELLLAMESGKGNQSQQENEIHILMVVVKKSCVQKELSADLLTEQAIAHDF